MIETLKCNTAILFIVLKVMTELNTVCQSLSDRLGDKAYFYNDRWG